MYICIYVCMYICLHLVFDFERLRFAFAMKKLAHTSDYLGAPRICAILVRNKPKTKKGRSSTATSTCAPTAIPVECAPTAIAVVEPITTDLLGASS